MQIDINQPRPLQIPGTGKILIFTEGTILGPDSFLQMLNFRRYVPIKNCVEKIRRWEKSGFEIHYMTSRRGKSVFTIRSILEKYQFPGFCLHYRGKNEEYWDIAQQIMPEYLVEDDCRSIGGSSQMTITHLSQEIRAKIRSVVVQEFQGIDDLPDDIRGLSSQLRIYD